MKKLIYNLLIVTLLLNASVGSAHAADKDLIPFDDNGNLVVAQCVAKGNLEFAEFLKAMTFSDGILDSAVEPFNDFLYRNQCQGNDVVSLINQRDKVRGFLRDAFLTCNTEKLPQLKTAFNKLSAEIYYVRHVVDGRVVVNTPADILTTRMLESPETLFTPSATLEAAMKERYVDSNRIDASEFTNFFAQLENKYKDRKKNYIKCESSSWQEVEKRWNKFIDDVGGTKPAFENAKKGIGARSEKLVEALTDMSLKAYMQGLFTVNFNNLGGQLAVNQLLSDLDKRYTPSSDVVTQSDLLGAIQGAERQYDVDKMRVQIGTTFEVLYKTVNDSASLTMVEELSDLDEVLKKSLKPLGQLKSCSDVINSRQCPIKK